MSMQPPNNLMCQECCWYRQAHHEHKSGWMTFLTTFNNLQKEEAIKNGKYKENFKTIINKYPGKSQREILMLDQKESYDAWLEENKEKIEITKNL